MSFVSSLTKKDSPSSGLFRVKVYNADAGASGHGMAQRNGTGMFPREVVPDWVHQQVHLHPYPKELMLRNHVQRSPCQDKTVRLRTLF